MHTFHTMHTKHTIFTIHTYCTIPTASTTHMHTTHTTHTHTQGASVIAPCPSPVEGAPDPPRAQCDKMNVLIPDNMTLEPFICIEVREAAPPTLTTRAGSFCRRRMPSPAF